MPTLAVIHVAKNPRTGVWRVMRDLAQVQQAPGVRPVFGLFSSQSWRREHAADLAALSWEAWQHGLGNYRASYLTLLFTKAISGWVDRARAEGATSVVVHSHDAWMSGLYVPLLGNWPVRTPLVATFHGVPMTSGLGSPLRGRLFRWLGRRLDASFAYLTSVDRTGIEQMVRLFHLRRDRCFHIPNGVSLPAISHRPSGERVRVGYVGSLIEPKGWLVAIEAVERLRTRGVACDLTIAGAGRDAGKVRRLAEARPWLRYLGSVRSAADLVIPDLDVVVLPSVSEGQPMVVLEAMAQGLPVVATPVGGVPALIDDGVSGLLRERTAEAFSEAIAQLVNPERRAALGTRAREKVQKLHELSAVSRQYLDLYRRALSAVEEGIGPC